MRRHGREANRVREQVDLASLIGETVPLVRCGSRLIGPCPFCQTDDDSESLEVITSAGMFDCSLCGRQGDAIEWLMIRDALTFGEAVRISVADLDHYRRVA